MHAHPAPMTLVLVLRWAAFAWMAFVAAFGGQIVRPAIGATTIAVVLLWSLTITLTPQRRSTAVIDLVVAATTLVLGGYAEAIGRVLTVHPSFAGIYPMAAVAVWAVVHGMRGGLIAGAVLACAVPAQYYANGVKPFDLPHLQTLALIGSMLAYPLLGGVVGAVTAQLLRLTALADQGARLEERARVAAEIHDDVLQRLAAVRRELADRPAVSAELARQERALRRIHLTGDAPVDTCSLSAALERLTPEFPDWPVHIASASQAPLPPATVTAVVSATREALMNVRKHAQAGQVWIAVLEDDDGVLVTVRDNGIGFDFDEEKLIERGRLGLTLSVKARVVHVGGTVRVKSRKGRGTEVEMWLPR